MVKHLSNVGSYKIGSVLLWCITICLIGYCHANNVGEDDECITPNGATGACMSIYECTHIINILNTTGSEYLPSLSTFITAAKCKSKNGVQHTICCAKRGFDMLNSQNCGRGRGDRVLNGVDAILRQFPWMALLQYAVSKDPYKCGGSLITDRYVLSAAHCVVDQKAPLIGVRLGEHDIAASRDCERYGRRVRTCNPPVQDFGIATIKPHPEYLYNSKALINDIALIKLNKPVIFQKHIKPICLPITAASTVLQANTEFTFAGWGITELGVQSQTLQYAKLTLKERGYCSNVYNRELFENHICTLAERYQRTCSGDSGGPLFAEVLYKDNEQRAVQYGTLSFGARGCVNDGITYPGVFANLIDLLPWIIDNIA